MTLGLSLMMWSISPSGVFENSNHFFKNLSLFSRGMNDLSLIKHKMFEVIFLQWFHIRVYGLFYCIANIEGSFFNGTRHGRTSPKLCLIFRPLHCQNKIRLNFKSVMYVKNIPLSQKSSHFIAFHIQLYIIFEGIKDKSQKSWGFIHSTSFSLQNINNIITFTDYNKMVYSGAIRKFKIY